MTVSLGETKSELLVLRVGVVEGVVVREWESCRIVVGRASVQADSHEVFDRLQAAAHWSYYGSNALLAKHAICGFSIGDAKSAGANREESVEGRRHPYTSTVGRNTFS